MLSPAALSAPAPLAVMSQGHALVENTAWRHRFSIATAVAGLFLIVAGGLVTSTGSGLAVPDWPLSFGTFFPRMEGGVFFEHGHRLIAGSVALLVLILAVWTGLREERKWVRTLGYAAAGGILLQALLGGMTVLMKLPPAVSISHACLGQTLFTVLVVMAVVTAPTRRVVGPSMVLPESSGTGRSMAAPTRLVGPVVAKSLSQNVSRTLKGPLRREEIFPVAEPSGSAKSTEHGLGFGIGSKQSPRWLSYLAVLTVALVYAQLILGAMIRHTGQGVVVHLVGAGVASIAILLKTGLVVFRSADERVRRLAWMALGLLLIQVSLGAWTLLFDRTVASATAHVATGALLLATVVVMGVEIWVQDSLPEMEPAVDGI